MARRRQRGEKTVKGRRSRKVAISEATAALFADWYAESVTRGDADPRGYVWPGSGGGPLHAHSPTHAVKRATTRAGLVDEDGKPLVSLHGLRHTCGSILSARGVPLIVVSRHLGHADPNSTAHVYAHLLSDTQVEQAAAVFAGLRNDSDLTPLDSRPVRSVTTPPVTHPGRYPTSSPRVTDSLRTRSEHG